MYVVTPVLFNVSRWTTVNRNIVPFTDDESRGTTSYIAALLDKYPAPSQSVDDVLTVGTISVELNRHNYVSQMRRLLQLEEMTQTRIIAKYVVCRLILCAESTLVFFICCCYSYYFFV